MEATVGQGTTQALVEEEKQESDLKALAGESVGVAGAVPFQQGMTLELTEIITKLVQGIRLLGEAESGENGLVNLYCGPAAEVAAAVEENLSSRMILVSWILMPG